MSRRKSLHLFVSLFLLAATTYAKDPPAQVIIWPDSGTPVMRFTFGKFKEVGSSGSQHNYVTDTTVENLWTKSIGTANFSLYLFDKNRVRIGEGWISVSNLARGEMAKFQTSVSTSGNPVSLTLAPRSLPAELQSFLPAKLVSITVNSVPQGALLRVDGTEAGTTPKIVQLGVGKHILEFSKEGFNAGRFPVEVGSDDASGGSVSYELGASSHDTIELRDGTVLSGDLESISATEVVVRAGGKDLSYDRNQVKRIILVQREVQLSPGTQPPQPHP
jgi:PEGA domain